MLKNFTFIQTYIRSAQRPKGGKQMNFIAIIGIIQELKKLDDQTCEIKIKVEKPFYRENEQWYEILSVWLNRELFNEELKAMSEGMIIGVKGRINNLNDRNQIIGERVQLF